MFFCCLWVTRSKHSIYIYIYKMLYTLLHITQRIHPHSRWGTMHCFGDGFVSVCRCQDDLLFVVGKMDGLMVVSGRRHNADDVVATALAVEPMKFVYRGR